MHKQAGCSIVKAVLDLAGSAASKAVNKASSL